MSRSMRKCTPPTSTCLWAAGLKRKGTDRFCKLVQMSVSGREHACHGRCITSLTRGVDALFWKLSKLPQRSGRKLCRCICSGRRAWRARNLADQQNWWPGPANSMTMLPRAFWCGMWMSRWKRNPPQAIFWQRWSWSGDNPNALIQMDKELGLPCAPLSMWFPPIWIRSPSKSVFWKRQKKSSRKGAFYFIIRPGTDIYSMLEPSSRSGVFFRARWLRLRGGFCRPAPGCSERRLQLQQHPLLPSQQNQNPWSGLFLCRRWFCALRTVPYWAKWSASLSSSVL